MEGERKENGPTILEGCEHVEGEDVCTRGKGGKRGLLWHLSLWHLSLDEAARGPFIVQESYLQVETASAKGDKW
jgi:hypothetical protein